MICKACRGDGIEGCESPEAEADAILSEKCCG